MKHVCAAILTLILGSSFVAGCSTPSENVATGPGAINAIGNVMNTVANSTSSGTNRTDSNAAVATSNATGTKTPDSSNNVPGNHTSTKSSERTNNGSKPKGTSTTSSKTSSKHSSTVSTTTHSSGHSNSTTEEQPNQSPTSGTKTNSTGSTTNGGKPPSTSASPTEIAATWTNKFNSMYVNRNYTGPNSSSFDGLVVEMAQGKVSPDAVKITILGMQPWDATWAAANSGDGKTYQFVVHDVGAFTYQTSVLNDDITSQQWRAHAQEVLDDSFYTKWDVYWNSFTKTYTVAFLDVGFYLNSTN